MELSKAQQEAVNTINGQIILVSCPGSGKTSTVIRRILHMVESGIPANQILALTFSKAAATEMRDRYLKLAGANASSAYFATIHSFCYNVILPIYRFSAENILTENEGWMIIRKGIDDLRKQKKLKMEIRDYTNFVNSCLTEISKIKNNGVIWDTYEADTCPTGEFKEIYNLYETQKSNMAKIDFDDMLIMCYQVFSTQPQVLQYYKNIFRYIVIDEFQDTNYLQRDILYMLAGGPNEANLCVVGDDDQSIYKFRGAKPEIMLGFPKQYPDCKQIYMDINYRSEPEIINAARELISHNRDRFPKNIQPAKTGHGIIKDCGVKKDEVVNLVSKIEELGKTMPYEDMAVLYRNNNQAGFLSMQLLGKKIPFHSNDKIISPYKHWIFSDLMAFYKLAAGEGTSQQLIQVINKPQRFLPVGALKYCPVDEKNVRNAVLKSIPDGWKRVKAMENISDFFVNLKLIGRYPEPDMFITMVQSMAGYGTYLKQYASYRNADVGEYTGILDSYKKDIKDHNIKTMDEWAAYANQYNMMIDRLNADKEKKGVTISTMHKSKGLEWRAVFLLEASEGIIPSPKCTGLDELEEERRLFYVAATRAKEQLYIFYTISDESGKGRSRFVSELLGQSKSTNPSKLGKIRFRKNERVSCKEYGDGTIVQAVDGAVAVKFDKETIIRKFTGDELGKIKKL